MEGQFSSLGDYSISGGRDVRVANLLHSYGGGGDSLGQIHCGDQSSTFQILDLVILLSLVERSSLFLSVVCTHPPACAALDRSDRFGARVQKGPLFLA